jgi:acetate CoA/acetoacetate CoA-transferase beta subunit
VSERIRAGGAGLGGVLTKTGLGTSIETDGIGERISLNGEDWLYHLVRGGHLDYTVLGAMQVDQEGNLANYTVPGVRIAGMGGAMDLVVGAKKVFVATDHCTKTGDSKILKKCTYPLTGTRVVDKIFTELCVIDVTKEGLVLSELMAGITVDDVLSRTEAELILPDNIVRA